MTHEPKVTEADRPSDDEVQFMQSLLDRYSEGGGIVSLLDDWPAFIAIVRKFVARHREAARREGYIAGQVEMRERSARRAEKRADDRFAEFGYTEWDTNASYYQGSGAEFYEDLDQEDEFIASAIRALPVEGEGHE